MRKLVFKKKKKVFSDHRRALRRFCKAAVVMLLVGTVAGKKFPVSAMELEISEGGVPIGRQSVSFVYHQHAGDAKKGGGCYQEPVYHEHAGSEALGGDCYKTPVYHVHEGDEALGGACYGTPVYHVHEGDKDSEGGCYGAVYHSHGSGCYKEVSSDEYGCYTEKTVDTGDGDYEGHDYKYYYMSCGRVIHGTDSSHTHSVLNCNKANMVVGYALLCGKTEESIEGYNFDCVKTEETIDSYCLSCLKTSDDIDGYTKNCGKDEDTPCGRIILDEEIKENRKKAVITVSFEDLTGGEITLAREPFTWYNGQGKKLGGGEALEISQNGSYFVKVDVCNENINKSSLKAKITVDNLMKPTSGKEDSDKEDSDKEDLGKDDSDEGGNDTGSNNTEEKEKQPEPSAAPLASPLPPVTANDGGAKAGQRIKEQKVDESKKEAVKETPWAAPALKKQTKTVKLEERKNEGEIAQIKVAEPERSFFASPVVKLITVTAGTLLSLCGLFLLLYLLRQSVKVYNDDGRGGMIYLGRCTVKAGEEGDYIRITEKMEEKAVTNRYCIRPGLFRAFKNEEEELTVCRQQKRISVPINKEMTAVL